MATDYYGLLGVEQAATDDQLKKAYRKLARELHPDVNPDPIAQERFKQVTSAYEVLSDPQKRQVVDLGGDPLAPGGGGGAPGQGFGGGFGDIMDAFFGGGGQSRGPRSRVRQGADALIRIECELAETAFGTTRELSIETAVRCTTCGGDGTAPGTLPTTCDTCRGRGEAQQVQRSFLGQVMTTRTCPRCTGTGTIVEHPCGECHGDGRVRARRTLNVKVPAGIEDGMRIRLAGEGEVGPGGGPPGDLFVEVREKAHPEFQRDGDAGSRVARRQQRHQLGAPRPDRQHDPERRHVADIGKAAAGVGTIQPERFAIDHGAHQDVIKGTHPWQPCLHAIGESDACEHRLRIDLHRVKQRE